VDPLQFAWQEITLASVPVLQAFSPVTHTEMAAKLSIVLKMMTALLINFATAFHTPV